MLLKREAYKTLWQSPLYMYSIVSTDDVNQSKIL